MFNKILQLLTLRCAHKKLSQPFSEGVSAGGKKSSDWDTPATSAKHYVVCLQCGRKFEYDWNKMKIVEK
ncbi:MAG TPA: hypothetical protein VEW69_12425 [Alphaproteobacteria bacterium]|nr:hypothetical protein [Alphaproteobacteria bacterium]